MTTDETTRSSTRFRDNLRTGAAIGLESVIPLPQELWSVVVTLVAGALMSSGTYRSIERVLIGLVIVMSVVFLVIAVMVRPRPRGHGRRPRPDRAVRRPADRRGAGGHDRRALQPLPARVVGARDVARGRTDRAGVVGRVLRHGRVDRAGPSLVNVVTTVTGGG